MENQLKQMALRAALAGIMSDMPSDFGPDSEFMRWYEDTTGEVERPDEMTVWAPFENENDDRLREHIASDADNMAWHFRQVLYLMADPVQELGMAIEKGDPQEIANKWLAIKPSVEEVIDQHQEAPAEEYEYSAPRP